MIGKFVVVRTYSAGVHCGFLRCIHETSGELTEARRIHRWRGANTLHEISLTGVDKDYSRISEPVEHILLTQIIEVIPTTEEAENNLRRSRWPR